VNGSEWERGSKSKLISVSRTIEKNACTTNNLISIFILMGNLWGTVVVLGK
jgi:hypothetical protein